MKVKLSEICHYNVFKFSCDYSHKNLGKVVPGLTEKSVLRMEVYSHLFIDLANGEGEGSPLPSGRFTPAARAAVTL